jgi:hypothetical protein
VAAASRPTGNSPTAASTSTRSAGFDPRSGSLVRVDVSSFLPQPDMGFVAGQYSLDAVDIAANNFGVKLDGTEQSVRAVEGMLARLHDDVAKSQPADEVVWTFAKAFGSYVGEAYRRRHGGEWGFVEIEGGAAVAGLRFADGRVMVPIEMVHRRITVGPAYDVWKYYRSLGGRTL